MTEETVGYVRLVWTCPNCGAKNPGPQKTCSGCGAAQPAGIAFEQAAEEKLVSDEAEIARAKAGPDVHCAYCGARNPAGTTICSQCGADLREGKARAAGTILGAHQTGPAPDVKCLSCGTMNPAAALKCLKCGASLAQPKPAPGAAPAVQRRGCGPFGYIAAGVGALLVLGVIAFLILSARTQDVTGIVQSLAWTRSVGVEQLGPVSHNDWRDQVPSGAVLGTCTQKVRRTQDSPAPNAEKVCGTPYTVDKGSGYGEVKQDCKYQVKDDWCEYTVKEWKAIEPVKLTGTDMNPRWPEVQLNADQREGQRQESYKIIFDADGRDYTYSTGDAAEFAKCQVGSRWILKVNTFGVVNAIEPAG
jgi:ribosomal protein L40E